MTLGYGGAQAPVIGAQAPLGPSSPGLEPRSPVFGRSRSFPQDQLTNVVEESGIAAKSEVRLLNKR